MSMLDKTTKETTKKKFSEELNKPVKIVHFTQEPSRLVLPDHMKAHECQLCKETKTLVTEVCALSDELDIEIFDFSADKDASAAYGIDKIPATIVMGEKDFGIRFFGIPSGYEYGSFIEAIMDVSKGTTDLNDDLKTAIEKIKTDVHLQVFATPTCPYCTMSVRTAHQFAVESEHIKADMVESTEFPHLVQKYNVTGVPKTIINETYSFDGAIPEKAFLDQITQSLSNGKKE
jgi:glutaredoxin-like protein